MRGKKLLKSIISTLITQIVTIVTSFIIPSALIKSFGSDVNRFSIVNNSILSIYNIIRIWYRSSN